MLKIKVTSSQLRTISIACQSSVAVQLLIDSGLPKLLSIAILKFCYRRCPSLQTANTSSSTNNSTSPVNAATTTNLSSENIVSDTPSFECVNATNFANFLYDLFSEENNQRKSTSNCPTFDIDTIADILNFFTETCAEGVMREWLGSHDGSIFWSPLLYLLCNNRTSEAIANDVICSFIKLEAATIKFLSKVTACHPTNQENLTVILIQVIKNSNNQMATLNATNSSNSSKFNSMNTNSKNISGFTRRLVLQLLLESERILVSITSKLPLLIRDYQTPIINHPSKRPNHHHLLFYVSTHTKIREILERSLPFTNVFSTASSSITDTSKNTSDILSCTDPLKHSGKEFIASPYGIGLGYGLELLSVQAGVTAKDKRIKEAKNKVAAHKAKDLLKIFSKLILLLLIYK